MTTWCKWPIGSSFLADYNKFVVVNFLSQVIFIFPWFQFQ